MEAILTSLDITSKPSAIVLIAVGLIIFYGVVAVALMGFILVNRWKIQYREQRDEQLMAKYEEQILEILISEQKRTAPQAYRNTVDRLRLAFTGSALRSLQKNIVLLGRDISGESAFWLHELYKDLQLDQRAIETLKHGSSHQKVAAVKELGRFQITHALPQLSDLSRDRHTTLRNEAQCTLLRLGGASQLNFLATLDEPITQWQQMRITKELKHIDPQELPDFHTYLSNPNEHVVVFVLKLIRLFNQVQAREAVINMLFDNRPLVLLEAVKTATGWLDEEMVELLMAIYEENSPDVHISVTEALRQWIYDQNTRLFLENIASATDDYILRMSALRSLKMLGGKDAITPLKETLDEAGQRCVNHQLDDRI